MSLTLITGRAGSGKTEAVFRALREASRTGVAAVLLLPTHPDVVRARRDLASRSIAGVRVDRIDDYIADVWKLRGDGRALVGAHQRRALLRTAAEQASFKRIATSASRPGFVAAMEPVVSRLGEYDRDDLTAESELDADILRLLDAYDDLLAASALVERGVATRLLCWAPPLDQALFVDGASDLSPRQRDVLIAWANADADVTITLPWEAGFAPTAALDMLVEEVSAAALRHEPLPLPARQGELARVEATLFGEPVPEPGRGHVVFCQAAGLEAEASLVAERVAALIAGEDGAEPIVPASIAVVFRDASSRVGALEWAFGARGIPVDLDVKVPLSATPLGRAVGQLVAFMTGEGSRQQLAGLARGPFVGLGHDVLDVLEATWRRERIADKSRLVADVAREDDGSGRLLKLAEELCRRPVTPETLAGWKRLLDSMLAQAYDVLAIEHSEQGASAARAHGAIMEALSELAELTPPVPAGTLGAVLRDLKVPVGPAARSGRVLVTEAHRLRSRRFEALVVGGLTADEFSSTGRPSLALEAAQRLTGLEFATDQAMERLLMYLVLTRADTHLEVVRLTADSEGRAIRPSIFWDELLDLYRPADPDHEEEEIPVRRVNVQMNDLGRVAPMITGDRRTARADACGEGSWALRAVELTDARTLAELAAREEFSATELEAYASCPYKWFYSRVVRPREIDRELDAREGGLLVHSALHRFYKELQGRLGVDRVTPACLAQASELMGRIFTEVAVESGLEASTLVETDTVDAARRRALGLVASDATFLPGYAPTAMLEYSLGDGGSVDLGGFRLKGRVDRVDRGPGGLVVQDYKWSRGSGHKKFADGRVLQLPLYAAAIRETTGTPVVAAVYRLLKDGTAPGYWRGDLDMDGAGLRAGDRVDAAGEQTIVETALETAREAVEGIRSGRIAIEPASGDACTFCAAAGFCPKGA